MPRRALLILIFGTSCLQLKPGSDQMQTQPLGSVALTRCGDGKLDATEQCDIAIGPGEPGACPTRCDSSSSCTLSTLDWSDCQTHCVQIPITKTQNGDGCCPPGADAASDTDCGYCGDEVVGPAEACDPPENCPTRDTCRTENSCVVAKFDGDAATCTARCSLEPIRNCRSGDGCCPSGCDQKSDSDCSTHCGDRVVDEVGGETCEPDLPMAPCPTLCSDGEACSRDMLIGSSQNCNALCFFTPIVEPADGDRCCPKGASALNDDDCVPECGNGVIEPGEECDGGDLCSTDCAALSALQRCASVMLTASPRCQECACEKCPSDLVDCYASSDATFNARCSAAVDCQLRSDCLGDQCLCGEGASCDPPNGPCASELTAAAGSSDESAVAMCAADLNCPLYWASRYRDCIRSQCLAECAR